MKKLYFLLLFLFSLYSFSQISSDYDFESLTFGDINNQDNWIIFSSLSTLPNINECLIQSGSEIPIEILNTINVGSYANEKAIVFNSNEINQSATASRKNDQNWSIPKLENLKLLFLDFVLGNGFENKEIRLAYDKNEDNDYAINCSTPDDEELGIGISTEVDAFGNYLLNLHSNSFNPIASSFLPSQNVTEYRLIIDFEANNNQGSISVFYKEFGTSENWLAVNSLQNIYAGFVINGENSSNPSNLDGLFIRQGTGLNAFFDNIQFQTISKDNDLDICDGDSIYINYNIDGVNFFWSDNTNNSSNYLSQEEILHTVQIIFNTFLETSDSFNLNVIPFGNADLGPDLSICPLNTELLTLENTLNVTYSWQDNSSQNSFLVTDEGFYSVEVNNLGCISYDTIYISYSPAPTLFLGNDTLICQDEINYTINPQTNGTSFKWQDGSTLESYNANSEGLYILEVALGQCVTKDSIYIKAKPKIKLGNDTTICEGQPLFLNVDTIYDDYSWFDGFKEAVKPAHYPSLQWLNATIDECRVYSDTIEITLDLFPVITSSFADTLICDDQPLELSVSGTDYELIKWHNFSEDTITTIVGEGEYWVVLSNHCGSDIDTINVSTENCNCKAFIPNSFSPNKDFLNDFYDYEFTCDVSRFSHKIFDKWGNLIFKSNSQENKWNGYCNDTFCGSGIYVSKFEFFYKNSSKKTVITRKISLNK